MAETYEGKLELLTEAEFIEHSQISVGVHLGRLGKAYRQVDVGILLRKIHQTLSMSAIAIGRKPPALAPTTLMAAADQVQNKDQVTALEALRKLQPDQRLEIFADFCTHCGSDNPRCQCWNDE